MRQAARTRTAARTASKDQATRERLLEAATALFAEHGFKRVTVRQIAETAQANIAGVNYHFGDKQGLYTAIFDTVIAAMKETNEAAFAAGQAGTPEQQLRAFVHVWLTQVTSSPRHFWIHRLMNRELDDPTDVLGRVFKEVIEPRMAYLASIVSALTGLEGGDPRLLRALVSIQAQCLMFAKPIPARAPIAWREIARDVDAVADHITEFSLAGLRALTAATPRG